MRYVPPPSFRFSSSKKLSLSEKISKLSLVAVCCALLAASIGCSKKSNPPAQNQPATSSGPQQTSDNTSAAQQSAPQAAMAPQQGANTMAPPTGAPPPDNNMAPQPTAAPPPLSIPAGTHLRVTLRETLSSKRNNPGDSFSASLATPVVVGGTTVIPAGTRATGTVVDAKAMGRFKGGAVLSIRLDRIGRYNVATSTVERVEKGKGKRSAGFIGGGAGLGAILGAVAGGGKGAAIGAAAGAGAGTGGAAFTGNKDLEIPAESVLTFRLDRSVTAQ